MLQGRIFSYADAHRYRLGTHYEPNSFGGPVQQEDALEPPLPLEGDAWRHDHRDDNDDYGQPRALFELFDAGQKRRLFANIAGAMAGVPRAIVERQLAHFDRVHPDYGKGVRQALKANAVQPEAVK